MGHYYFGVIVERLLNWGMEVVFGLPGDGIEEFMGSSTLGQDRTHYIDVRYEETPQRPPLSHLN
jgi:pyruvate dehydrogenase (quinone)